MEILLLHLVGDFITQTHWMAVEKKRNSIAAGVHALVYAVPFFLFYSWQAVAAIGITHFFIDRYALARYLCFAKNWLTQPSLRWADTHETGYPQEVPVGLSTGLVIVVDNTMHLVCNYVAVIYL